MIVARRQFNSQQIFGRGKQPKQSGCEGVGIVLIRHCLGHVDHTVHSECGIHLFGPWRNPRGRIVRAIPLCVSSSASLISCSSKIISNRNHQKHLKII